MSLLFNRCLLCLFLPLIIGCQSDPGPVAEVFRVVKASGTLTFEGKPLPGYQVTFTPAGGERVAVGISDAEGRFQLGTNAPGDGAVVGQHKVAIVWVAPVTEDDTAADPIDDPSLLPKPPVKLPAKFSSAETSGLSFEVPSGGVDDLKIEL